MELAHISDLHVRWRVGQAGPWHGFLNKRVLGGLNLLLKRSHPVTIMEALVADLRAAPPDHLAITGDLTNLALAAEFARARELIDAIELPPARISLIPGNHDTYTRGAYRGQLFEQAFAEVLAAAEPVAPDAAWPRVQRQGDVLLISTTSCVPTPWFSAYGRMGAVQIARVGEALRGSGAGFKVVLVHHPPLLGNGRPDHPLRRNRDGASLVHVCQEAGADLILCGHTHRGYSTVVDGPRPLRIVCGGSTTSAPRALGEKATYNRYQIEGGALRAITVRGYDPATGRFEHVATRDA